MGWAGIGAENRAREDLYLKPSLMPFSGVLKITPRFHGHLEASLEPLSGVIKLTLPIETPVIHVPLSGRVGGTLPHKSLS